MNIFHVLSQGKSRLHEPSMSAMLGYLLDSSEDHGLGDAFIRIFIKNLTSGIFDEELSMGFINSTVSLEEPYQLSGQRKDIDIQISLLDNNLNESHRVVIENKIKISAANPKQLNEYYQAIIKDDEKIKKLTIVFLTPEKLTPQLTQEFDNLKIKTDGKGHEKKWIHWNSNSESSIVSLLKNVLAMESDGRINPINEYMRHTLKAFIKHVSTVVETAGQKHSRTGKDLGEIVQEAKIALKDGKYYRVIRRDSTQIQVFNDDTGDKEIARYILGKFIDENKIGIDHSRLNTRSIGREFFNWRSQNNLTD